MNLRKITILLLAILLSLPMAAQKRKRNTRPKPAPVVEEPQEDPRITNMREMTQQIIIVDSIVVNKDQFLASIRLSSRSRTNPPISSGSVRTSSATSPIMKRGEISAKKVYCLMDHQTDGNAVLVFGAEVLSLLDGAL